MRSIYNYLLPAFFVFIFLGNINKTHATHIAGGQITYTYVSAGKYEVTLSLFRDCSGINMNTGSKQVRLINKCGQTWNSAPGTQRFSLAYQGTVEVSQTCPSAKTTCVSGGTVRGVQKYTWKGTVTYPTTACTNGWFVAFNEGNRDNGISNITTFPSSQSQSFYIHAFIDSSLSSNNNSATFSTDPTPYVCIGQAVSYSFGAFDSDGDSLVFEFAAAQRLTGGTNQSVTYRTPTFAYTEPIVGAKINSKTGDISFTAPATQGKYVVRVDVLEYKSGASSPHARTPRDFQVYVDACVGNNVPTIASGGILNVSGGARVDSTTVKSKKGNTVCYEVKFNDANASDTITVTTNAKSVLPGTVVDSSLGVNSANGKVCWTIPTTALNSYNVSFVAKDNNCPVNGAVSITTTIQLVEDLNKISITGVKESCFKQNNGTLTAVYSGGIGPYGFRWDSAGVRISAQTETITGIPSNVTYVVTVIDSFDLDSAKSTGFNLAQTLPVTIATSSTTNIGCDGGCTGEIDITSVSGGNTTIPGVNGFSYKWSGTTDTTANPKALCSGTHLVTISDDNNCDTIYSFFISQPPAIQVDMIDSVNVSCKGGSDGSAKSTAKIIECGVYGTTSSKCTSTSTATLGTGTSFNGFAGMPTPFGTSIGAKQQYLYLASELKAAGFGKGRISALSFALQSTFTTNFKEFYLSIGCTDSVDLDSGFTNSGFQVYSASTHSFSVADLTSNEPKVTFDQEFEWDGNSNIVVTICFGKSGSFNAQCKYSTTSFNSVAYFTSATSNACVSDKANTILKTRPNIKFLYCDPAITYSWNTSPVQTDSAATGLKAGSYRVVASNLAGCKDTATVTITEPAVGLVLGTTVISNPTCNGGSNGSASVQVTGGTPGFTFAWPTGVTTTPDSVANNLKGGTKYLVTVTDSKGCFDTITVQLTDPPAISFGGSSQVNVLCKSASTGSITVVPAGGTSPYPTYTWTPNVSTTASATNLAAGSYKVEVTDNNGCKNDTTFVITEPAAGITFGGSSQTNVLCKGASTGSITVVPSGGTSPYPTYTWTPNVSTTASATNLAAGSYKVEVTDNNGCKNDTTFVITEPSVGITFGGSSQTNVICKGASTGSITVVPAGGTSPYPTYTWTPNVSTTATASNLAAGSYKVEVTDNNGCKNDTTFVITEPATGITFGGSSQTNVLCKGASTGSITVVPAGGTSPYPTYTWTPNVSTTATASNLSAGSYKVEVTDNNGCKNDTTFVITEPAAGMTFGGSSQTNVSCKGASTGSITVVPAGGTSPYPTFAWTPNVSTTATASNLAAGSYKVEVTDNNGCKSDTTFVITEPASGITFGGSSQTNVSCKGASTGSITVVPSGGTSPYPTFAWTPNVSTTATASNLAAGSYKVEVTDNNGCKNDTTFVITEPSVGITFGGSSQTNVVCKGASTGSITVVPAGGTSPYPTFTWTPNVSTTATASNLAAGSYKVEVTDNNGCKNDTTFVITEPATGITFGGSSQTNVSCKGASTGSITVVPSGGTSPYPTYTWTPNVSTTATASNLSAGSYKVEVTDNNGCKNDTTFVITEPAAGITFGGSSQTNASCKGASTGSITVVPSGGTSPYPTYTWTPNVSTTATASNLSAGSYKVEVTDNNGCKNDTTFIITEPAAGITFGGSSQINVACMGASTGSITVVPAGGTSPYPTFTWTPNVSTTATASNLAAGSYKVEVTDNNGCKNDTTFIITQPATGLTSTMALLDTISCKGGNDGRVSVTPSGGTTPYTYNWSSGSGGVNDSISGTLSAGKVIVTITSAGGCTTKDSLTLVEPATALRGVFVDKKNPTCTGSGNDGSIKISVSGGVPTYTYAWTGSGTSTGPTDSTRSAMTAGPVSVLVTDSRGCTATFLDTLVSPGSLSVAFTDTILPTCYGDTNGRLIATHTGGTGAVSYSWTATQGMTGTSDSIWINAKAENISVEVTDALGCKATAAINLTQPDSILITVNVLNQVLCKGDSTGRVRAIVTGGAPVYTYNWNGIGNPVTGADSMRQDIWAGNFNLTVSDSKGCSNTKPYSITEPAQGITGVTFADTVLCRASTNGTGRIVAAGGTKPYTYAWSAGSGGTNDSVSTNMPGGPFTVTVTDAGGCTGIFMDTISSPDSLKGTFTQITQPACGGSGALGSVTVTPTGGTPNASSPLYTYTWIGGGTNGSNDSIRVNIPAGTIKVVITDKNGCTSDTISQNMSAPGNLSPTFTLIQDPKCNGDSTGSLIVTPTGGTPGYTYVWNLGVTGSSDSVRNSLPGGVQIEVIITDASSCIDTAKITLNNPVAINLNFTDSTLPTCSGDTNGSITVTPLGGLKPYTYSWSNGDNDSIANNVGGGIFYTVTVTDNNGCSSVDSMKVSDPVAMTVAFTDSSTVSCNGGSDGSLTITPSGGTPIYGYAWTASNSSTVTTGASDSIATGLSANVLYTVTVTDGNGCKANASKSLDEPNAITAVGVGGAARCGLPTGNARLIFIRGGTPTYTISWDSAGTSFGTGNPKTGLYAGLYTATVTDSKGCTESFQVNVSNRRAPIVILDSLQDAFCEGVCSGGIDIRVISFSGIPVTYKWSNGDTTQDIVKQCAGFYSVTVTDTNGCVRIANYTIGVQDTLNVSLTTTPLSCNTTSCDGAVSATPTNGFPAYSYQWSSATTDTLSGISNKCAGKYIVTVTDTKGCIAIDSATLLSPTNLSITSSSDSVSCNGGSDGVAKVTGVSGGLAPIKYQWSSGTNDTFAIKSALMAGTYYVTVSEAGGCSKIDTVVVEEPNGMSATTVPVFADCGQSNGKITINITGGKSPLSYNWPVGGIKALNTDSGYSAGAYNVIVSDGNGCSATFPFNINNKNGPVITFDSIKHETCVGDCDGGIYVSVTGGTPNYIYSWSPGSSTTQDLTSACPGAYDLRVADQNNCITIYSDTIEGATKVIPNATVVNHATSKGGCDGRAKATPTGGKPGYTYKWSSGSTSDTANGLCAGNHIVTVTDANGCIGLDTVTITEPLNLILDSVHTYDATCQKVPCDGRMRIFVSGGTGTYTYKWDNGHTTDSTFTRCAGTLVVTVTDGSIIDTFRIPLSETKSSTINTALLQDVSCNGGSDGAVYGFLVSGQAITSWTWSPSGGSTDTAKGLTAGVYTVSATNSFGCDSYDTITVNEPSPFVTASDTTSPSCGVADGQIIARVSGGTSPYTIQWLDASMNALVPPQTGDTAKNLAAGIYHYRVTDKNGCMATQQVILVDKNAPRIQHDSTRDISCFGKCDGGIFITAIGGSGILSYAWSPGGKTTPDLDSACSGVYTVKVTDALGCSSTFQDTIAPGIALSTTVTKILDVSSSTACDGAASVLVTGGKPTYKYIWTSGATASVANNLCKGMNYVTVTDTNGCSGIDSVLILEPNVLKLTKVDTTQPACGKCDGKIKITVSGGTTPYTYKWDNGDTADSTLNRCAGVIQVTVSDGGSLSQVFNIGLNSSNAPTLLVSVTDASCNGSCDGTAIAFASSGTSPYTFNWPTIAVSGPTISGRCKGVYLVEVRDSKGCVATDSADIKEPSKIVASVNVTIADCGKSNGSATVTAVGGKSPYKYKWSTGPITTTPTLTGLAAGAYFVTVEDASKCSVVLPFSIVNPNGPTIKIDTVNNEVCNGSCDGSIFITASGTPGPYSYKWTPGGSTNEDLSNLCAGVYTVEVTDFNKCISVAFDTVKGPPSPGQTISVSNHATAFGKCDAKAYITIPGGTSGYNFQWTSSEVGDTAKALCAGINYVTITNSKGCQFVDSVLIREPQRIIITSKKVDNPNCNVCDGKITVTIAGGTPPYSYKWDNGDATDSTTKRCAGIVFLTVTDKNNYSEVFQIGLNNKTSPSVSFVKTDARCSNSCDGQISVIGSGTVSPYTYNWPTIGSKKDTVTNLCSGNYLVEVKDKVGCIATQSVTISAPSPISVSFTKTLPKCGINSGLIFSTTSGGTQKTTGYDYSWLDNAQFAIVPAQTSDKLLNVGAGLYHLEVTDSLNCIDTVPVTLNNIGGASIALDSLKNASCAGVCDGEISVTGSGGPVTYLWFPGGATTKAVTGLCATSYTVEVTDTAKCKTLNTFNISAPNALKVVAREITDATCFNTNDGQIKTLVNEVGKMSYQWSGIDSFAGTNPDASNLLAGNYKVIVTNEAGCSDSMSANVGIKIDYSINAGGDSVYCGTQTVPIWNSTTSTGFYTTTWYNEKGVNLGQRDSITVSPPVGENRYIVEVRQEVCVQYDTVEVTVEESYALSAGKDRTIIKGQRSTLGGSPTAPTGKTVLWTPSTGLEDPTKQNPVATPLVSTIYIVSGGSEGGCIVHDTIKVNVEDRIVVNDAFSPNGDGVNDKWEIGILQDYPNAKVQIFNRWGQLLYESFPYDPWDGTFKNEDMPLGTYYYIIDLNDESISTQTLSGAVTIIR